MTEQTTTPRQARRRIEPRALLRDGDRHRDGGRQFIVGQEQIVRQTLISLLAGWHALLEGVPGLGKTMLVRTLAEALDLGFRRIQFTPDLMPADIIGTNVIVEEGGERRFRFQQGPIFAQHRAGRRDQPRHAEDAERAARGDAGAPRHGRQAAVHAGRAVLRAGHAEPARDGGHLPAARGAARPLLLQARRAVPVARTSSHAILERTTGTEQPTVGKAATGAEVLAMQQLVREVPVARTCRTTRSACCGRPTPRRERVPEIVRAVRALRRARRAARRRCCSAPRSARCSTGASTSSFDDVQAVAAPALRHRMILNFEGEAEGISTDSVVRAIIAETPTEPAE